MSNWSRALFDITNYRETLHLLVSTVITFVITQEGGTVRCLRFCHRSECRSGKKCTQPFLYHTKYVAISVYTFDEKTSWDWTYHVSTSTLFCSIKQFQGNSSISLCTICFVHTTSVILKCIQYKEKSEEENTISVFELYSPRRASHLLSDQLLMTHFFSELLPFAPGLKLKYKEQAAMDWECVLTRWKMPMPGCCTYTQFKWDIF